MPRHRNRTSAALPLVVLALSGAPAAAGPAHAQALADLYARYQTDRMQADYLFVIDFSVSMNELLWGGTGTRYEAAQEATRLALQTLGPGDMIEVIGFHAGTWSAMPRRQVGAHGLRTLPAWPAATGGATDLGRALEATVDPIAAADPNRIQLLFFLTDGLHQPPADSRYPAADGPAWTGLRTRAAHAAAGKTVLATGLALDDATDIHMLRRVWPDAVILPADSTSVSSLLRELREDARRLKLRAQVSDDLRAPFLRLDPPREPLAGNAGGMVEVPLVARSLNPRLDAVVTLTSTSVGRMRATAGGAVTLARGDTATLGTVSVPLEPLSWWEAIRRALLFERDRGEVTVRVALRARALPDAQLRNLLLADPAWAQTTATLRVPVVRRSPVPWWLVWVVVLALASIAVRTARCRRRNVLRGRLRVTPPAGRGTVELVDLEESLQPTLAVLARSGDGRLARCGPQEREGAVLVVEARGCGTAVWAVSRAPDDSPLREEGAATDETELLLDPGTGFTIGGYGVRYERE